jgi:tetratricopeptide (TPR) repeat protein
LLHDDRQRLHGQVAALIEADAQLPGDERIPLLAYHFAASATPFRAVPYLLAAAEHSARTYSNETAIQQYRHALELIEAGAAQPLPMVALAIIGLARALKFTGQFGEAAVMLRRAVESLGDTDSEQRRLLAEALRELADVYHRDGELESAVAALQRGIALLATEQGGQARQLWRSLLDRLAALHFRQGDLGEADRLATWATSHAPEQDDQDPITLASI